jgi:hypothetical protein
MANDATRAKPNRGVAKRGDMVERAVVAAFRRDGKRTFRSLRAVARDLETSVPAVLALL